jgi:hypothetical protein
MTAVDAVADRQPRFPSGVPRVLFVLILLLAAALRAGALDKPFYVDEITTITIATQPLSRMAEAMREVDASPALYPVLLHFWLEVARSDAWTRALSAIFGLAAVAVVGLLGSRAFGWRTGLAAAFVMAIAPGHVHYAQYVRNYSLFTLLAAIHVLLFVEWLEPRATVGRGRALLVLAVTTALLYTHYLSMLLFAGEAVAGLLRLKDVRTRVLAWGGIVAIGGVLFLPGVPLLLHNAAFDRVRNAERAASPPLVELVPNLAAELMVGQRSLGFDDPAVRRATLAAAAVLFPALWMIGVAQGWRSHRYLTLILCLVSLVPFAIYLGSGRKLVAVRFFLPFAAGYLVLLGHGLASLRGIARWTAVAALSVLSAVPLTHFYRTFSWSYDHRAVARALEARAHPGDVVLVTHPYEAFYYRWYLDARLPVRGLLFTPIDEQDTYVIKPADLRFEQAMARVLQAASGHPRFWFVGQSGRSFAGDAHEEARLIEWLERSYRRVDDLGTMTGSDPVIRLYEVGASPPGAVR